MNTSKIVTALCVCVILLSACSPRLIATPEPSIQTVEVLKTESIVEVQSMAPAAEAPAVGIQPQPLPGAMYFEDYGVNAFTDASEDHFSTFAIDVDTASYTVAREYILDGNLPPQDAVRVEEFVNYFDQDYPTPDDIAFAIYADGAPSPFHSDGTHFLRIGIQGYQVPDSQRKPAALTFVIDSSGSMADNRRLELVKQSLSILVEQLHPDDMIAIVAYSNDAWVVLSPTSAENKNRILSAIQRLEPMRSTNAADGIRLGYDLATQMYMPRGINRVILASDGVANVGPTGPDEILELVRGYVSEGISLTSIGVGMGNYNDVLLEQLANDGDGNYYYVNDEDEAERVFVNNLTSTLQTIARDAKVQVDFNPDIVSRYRLVGYENRAVADEDFRDDSVDAGELGAGHSVTAIYALQLEPLQEGRIATVQVRWQDPDTYQIQEMNGNFNTWDITPSFESASPRFQLSVIVAQFAELLRNSPWARGTYIDQLLDHAVRLSGLMPGDQDVTEFVALLSRANQISQLPHR